MVGALAPREDFPLLARTLEGSRLIYLDSAATALKPRQVIDEVVRFYREGSANIHRGKHWLSHEASEAFEAARSAVARFINALPSEVVFTASATEGVNLVAEGLELERGDNVIASVLEHHSNLLPWMSRCEVRLLPEGPDGRVDLERLDSLIDPRTRALALTHISNVTGAINPVREAVERCHRRGVPVLLDGAQSVPHQPIDVVELGCDFLVFSGHKMLGPSGVGVLYVNQASQDRLRSWKLGGGVVDRVWADRFTLKAAPYRFEAGTPNIEGVLGLRAAVEYLERLGMERVAAHDRELSALLLELCRELEGVRLLGPTDASARIALASLVPERSALDVDTLATMLSDGAKIMVRSGQHCAHPYFEARGMKGSLRLSAYVYTTPEELRAAFSALKELLS
jgi:cysteine desulfurase / selenocysteine lyase